LREGGFRSVLGLITTLKGRDPVELGLDRLEIVPLDVIGLLVGGIGKDFKLFERAVETLEELVRDAPPVLVHCRAGRSRSPVVVAGYLMKSLGIKSERALLMLAAQRELE